MTTQDENKELVREAFRPWERGDSRPFFDLIADDVAWTVIGSTPASGKYASKQAVIDQAFGPLLERLEGPLKTRFIDIAADGQKVFLRFQSTGIAKTGLHYDRTYCFAMVMHDGRIVEIVAYLDTDLLAKVFS
jgi:ketosteroid isomerase-like protein